MEVCVLVLDGVFDLGLSAVLDTLSTANDLAVASGRRGGPMFRIRLVGVRRKVITQQGLSVPVGSAPADAPDMVVIPALGCKVPDALRSALARKDVAAVSPDLRIAEDLGVKSVGRIELAALLEDELGVEIGNFEMRKPKTVREVIGLVNSKL